MGETEWEPEWAPGDERLKWDAEPDSEEYLNRLTKSVEDAWRAGGTLPRVAALADLIDLASRALHGAVTEALYDEHTWREIAPHAGMSFQTLHRQWSNGPFVRPPLIDWAAAGLEDG